MEWPFMCSVVHNVKVDIKEIYIQFLTGYARILCLLTLTQRKYVIVWMTSRIPDDIRWPNYFRHPHHDQKQRCSHDCRDFYTHYFEFHLSLSAPNLSVKLGEYNADHQLDRKIHLSCHLPATAIMMRWMNTSPPFVKYSRKSKHWQIVICSWTWIRFADSIYPQSQCLLWLKIIWGQSCIPTFLKWLTIVISAVTWDKSQQRTSWRIL